MSDLIDRQQAIDVIDKEQKEIDVSDVSAMYAYSKCKTIIKQLPSVLSTNLAAVGTDTISRQQAIETFKDCAVNGVGIDGIVDALEQLPPIQPKRGRWILDRSGAYCCSECMEPCAGYVMMKPRDKFCKMCGAKMEVTT